MEMNPRYLSCAETAKQVRKALAEAFAGVKFSVRSKAYAGGASITVGWIDGPLSKDVDAVIQAFAGADFDGSTDYKSHHVSTLNGEVVRFGADFIFTAREISAATMKATAAALQALSPNERNRLAFHVRPTARSMENGAMPNDEDLRHVAYSIPLGTWTARSATADGVQIVRSY